MSKYRFISIVFVIITLSILIGIFELFDCDFSIVCFA